MFSKKTEKPTQFFVGHEKSITIEGRTLNNVAISHIGEALGHNLYVDETFQKQIVELANKCEMGFKSFFTHGDVNKDSLGSYLGAIRSVRIDSDGVVRGNLVIADSADLSPEGKLGAYVLQLSRDNPLACGLSLSFNRDRQAEKEFVKKFTVNGKFSSPDARNTENYPHVRISEIFSCDVVSVPATNPTGLFEKSYEENQMAKIEELEAEFKSAKPEWLLAALKSNKSIDELKAEFSAMQHEEALKAKDAEIASVKAENENLKKSIDELNKAVAEFKAKKEPVAFSAPKEGQPSDWKAAVQMIIERDKVSFADARAKLEVEFPALAMAVRTGK